MIGLLEQYLTHRTTLIIDEVIERGSCDFVTDLAAELPLQAIAEIMGVPQEDRKLLFDWSNRMIGSEDPEYATNDTQTASAELYGYVNNLARLRKEEPRDDIVTKLINSEIDGDRLSDAEFEFFMLLLTVAGNETTRNTTSWGMHALMQHPEQYQLLRENPELLDGAVEEILRWASPVYYFRRTAMADTEIHGQPIAKDDKVVMWYISANRDETVYEDPFRFDITRTGNEHVAFGGGGTHFCLGANLARAELRILFAELIERIGDMKMTAEPDILRSNFIGGVKHMPVAFTPDERRAPTLVKQLGMDEMRGRAGVITGAAQGIGLAIATAVLREGADVIVADRDIDAGKRAAESLSALGPGRAFAAECDVTDEAQVAATAKLCTDTFGSLDFWVNNAGITRDKTLRNMTLDDFKAVLDVHLVGGWLGTRAAAEVMREQRRGSDRQHFLDQRQGRQPRPDQLLGREGRPDRPDESIREGAGQVWHPRQRGAARPHPHDDDRSHEAGGLPVADRRNPASPRRRTGRSRRGCALPALGAVVLYDGHGAGDRRRPPHLGRLSTNCLRKSQRSLPPHGRVIETRRNTGSLEATSLLFPQHPDPRTSLGVGQELPT